MVSEAVGEAQCAFVKEKYIHDEIVIATDVLKIVEQKGERGLP